MDTLGHRHQRSPSSSSTAAHKRSPHPHLPIPPAPAASDLPLDKELLQRWSTNNSPSGTPGNRPLSFSKRHASFDSPREVPLPSPSASSLSPGALSSTAPFFSNINLNTTPSANTTASQSRFAQSLLPSSSRAQDVDYFPPQPRSSTTNSSSSSASSSQQSSRASKNGISPPECYPVFEGEHTHGSYERARSDSDWTRQTSPSPPSSDDNQRLKQHSALYSDLTAHSSSRSPSQLDPGMGSTTMTPSSQPPSIYPDTANNGTMTTLSTPIFPFSRPYSLPEPHSKSYHTTDPKHSTASSYVSPSHQHNSSTSNSAEVADSALWPDRNSTASLPLPMQIPFHALRRAGDAQTAHDEGLGRPRASVTYEGGASSSGEGVGSPRAKTHYQQHYPYHHHPPPSQNSSSSSSSSSSYGSLPSADANGVNSRVSPPPSSATNTASSAGGENSSQHAPPAHSPSQRPTSPIRAPQPRATSTTPSTFFHSTLSRTQSSTVGGTHGTTGSSSGPASFFASSYPAPEPPTILVPSSDGPGRPYDPFLSHAPPPADSWIEVETAQSEYKLNVRLPGFRRDGITLATKRRRILHVVADSWENGGGHFERRISFGYDADLVQVRAEFDGEMLRISIPRRLPPISLWHPSRTGPVGRSG